MLQISLWSGAFLGSWLISLLLLQALFGRQMDRLQIQQLGRNLALNVRLTELTLERYPPSLISDLTGLDLIVRDKPTQPDQIPATQKRRINELQTVLCNRLSHCPHLLPAGRSEGTTDVWIELISPLEPVWLGSQLPATRGWPPEPMLLLAGVISAIVITGVLYLLIEVERPLRGLETALARVGEGSDPASVPRRGAPEVQRITTHFNAMVERLAANRRERATMLAGIAHDLRAPITRLRFRLSMAALSQNEREACTGDLESLERITGQFLLYAGGGEREAMVTCPVDHWLAEVSAGYSAKDLRLELVSIHADLRPVAMGRAVGNLIDNAFNYGKAPVVVRLKRQKTSVVIEVWDQGEGIPAERWERALQPFQRLDEARGAQGHCGLGLAIVSHVVDQHGGKVQFLRRRPETRHPSNQNETPGQFAVTISIPTHQ
jgi:two-component system, OmpR family, osmolarity sensor histidine kinase EnvZ